MQAGNKSPYDMLIKLLLIGDSGKITFPPRVSLCVCLIVLCELPGLTPGAGACITISCMHTAMVSEISIVSDAGQQSSCWEAMGRDTHRALRDTPENSIVKLGSGRTENTVREGTCQTILSVDHRL